MEELSPFVDLPVCPFQLFEFSFTFTYAGVCMNDDFAIPISMQRKTT
jgi:hypothetical protein